MNEIDVELIKMRTKVVSESEDMRRWVYYDQANCYQYMMNIEWDFPELLQPGEIYGECPIDFIYEDDELVELVKKDLEILCYEMHISNLEEPVVKNGWKFAILNCITSQADNHRYDFHFLRQNENGNWYHKYADEQHPDCMDIWNNRITNPEKAKYYYQYHLVGYYMAIPKQKLKSVA